MKISCLVQNVSLRRRTYGTIRLSRCAAGKKVDYFVCRRRKIANEKGVRNSVLFKVKFAMENMCFILSIECDVKIVTPFKHRYKKSMYVKADICG